MGILIVDAAITMIRKMKTTPLATGILVVATAVLLGGDRRLIHISSITLMIAAGLVGFAVYAVTGKKVGAEG